MCQISSPAQQVGRASLMLFKCRGLYLNTRTLRFIRAFAYEGPQMKTKQTQQFLEILGRPSHARAFLSHTCRVYSEQGMPLSMSVNGKERQSLERCCAKWEWQWVGILLQKAIRCPPHPTNTHTRTRTHRHRHTHTHLSPPFHLNFAFVWRNCLLCPQKPRRRFTAWLCLLEISPPPGVFCCCSCSRWKVYDWVSAATVLLKGALNIKLISSVTWDSGTLQEWRQFITLQKP